MNEEQRRQVGLMLIVGAALTAAFAAAIAVFALADIPGSFLTRSVLMPLFLGALWCFVGAYKTRKTAKATNHR